MIRLVLTSFVFLLTLTSVAFGQFTFNIVGGGARAQAMGNAYIAVSDDAGAVGWNPAGLVAQEDPILTVNWGSLSPRGAVKAGGQSWDATGNFRNIGQAAFVAPLRISGHRFVGSAGYTGNIEEFLGTGGGRDIDTTITRMVYSSEGGEIEHTFDTRWTTSEETDFHSNLNSVNFGFGTPLKGNVSLGMTLNIYSGKAVRNSLQGFVMGTSFPADKYPQSVVYRQMTDVVDTVKYGGFNFSIGLKYDGERSDFGLLLRTPFELSATTDRSIYVTTTYNGTLQSGSSPTIFQDDDLVKYEMPWFVGLGYSFNWTPDLLTALDVEYRGFNGKKVKNRVLWYPNDDEEVFYEYDLQWYNTLTVRAGCELMTHWDSDLFPEVPFRLGFAYLPVPYSGAEILATVAQQLDSTSRQETFDRALTEQAKGLQMSMGTGIHWSQIHLDVAYVYTKFDLDFDHPALGADPFTIETRDHKVSFNFTGYF